MSEKKTIDEKVTVILIKSRIKFETNKYNILEVLHTGFAKIRFCIIYYWQDMVCGFR
jgi:hypothetical protein